MVCTPSTMNRQSTELNRKVRIILIVSWKPWLSLPLWSLLSCSKPVYFSLVGAKSVVTLARDIEAAKRTHPSAVPRSRSLRISIVNYVTTR